MEENKLKKALTPAGIWAVAVGAVISGNYYGWNYIFSETNFTGALIAMAIAALFYIPFAFMNLINPIFAFVTALLGRNILYADGTKTNLFTGKLVQGRVAEGPEEGHAKALEALKQIRGE